MIKMAKIKLLSPQTVNKIAAGEVIERPASVVKELIENSLDAQANKIYIQVKKGGKDSIIVKDNGHGMSKEEVKLALKKHATSKIKDIHDLNKLNSLGFRGEALPSIASVSKVKIQTKEKDGLEGTEVIVEGGDIKDIDTTGCPVGTKIEVSDLFYNTPARKKYLKKTNTELAHISDIVTRNALSRPNVEFTLTHNNNEIFFVPKANSRLENIKSIYGLDVAKKMIKLDCNDDYLSLNGYISKPDITRSNRKHMYVYVNGRYIENSALKDSIMEGYKTILPRKRYPITVINLSISGSKIDVNVHPTKTQIRFQELELIKNKISKAVKNSLLEEDLIPHPEKETGTNEIINGQKANGNSQIEDEKKYSSFHISQQKLKLDELESVPESKLKPMKILGTLKNSYIISETPDGLALIDQHAAHERINYENLKKKYDDEIKSQKLISPKTIELKPREAAILKANKNLLKELGFKIEPFGRTTFRVTEIPVVISEIQEEKIIHSVLDELVDLKGSSLNDRREEIIKYMACRSSVMAGDDISVTKARNIIKELGRTDNPYTCPHGRPTIIKFSEKELEKMFKRT